MNDWITLLLSLGIIYILMIHIAYFIFGAYFKNYFGREFNYWSIWYMGFKFKKKNKK